MEELGHFQQILCTISMLLIKVENGRLCSQVKTEMNKPSYLSTNSVGIWRSEWLPTPVFLPGEPHGQRSLKGYCPQGYKESDSTEHLNKKDNSPVHLAISCYHLAASYGCYPAWSLKTAEFAVPKWSRNKNRINPCFNTFGDSPWSQG